MLISKKNLAIGLSIAALAAFSLPSQAIVIGAGDTVALPGTTVAANPHLAGVVLEDEIIDFSFYAGGDISGKVQQRVVRSSTDNTIDFYWRVMNDDSSDAAIGSFRVGQFDSPEYDVDWRIDGLGDEAPPTAHRFGGAMDNFVNFIFDSDGLLAGDSSNFFFFDTTATSYSKTALFDLTGTGAGGISTSFAAFEPAAANVSEPATFATFGLGLMALFLKRRGLKKERS